MSAATIGFAGMTHLGLISAVAAAEKGFDVVCYDDDSGAIARLGRGDLPVAEPNLAALFASNRDRLHLTAKLDDLEQCDVLYVAPDVPTDGDGLSDLGPVSALIERVAPAMNEDAVLVILSQVPPGFTRAIAGKVVRDVAHPGAHLFYQVETLIFGRALERALAPERFIIGAADPAMPLPPALAGYLAAYGCPVLPMGYESAELAKISINMCLVGAIAAANSMAELCEHIGADWSEITPALRLDKRIGQHAYIAPGLGLAGGNLERDLATVIALGDAAGTDLGVVRAWQANSRHRRFWALGVLHDHVLANAADAVIAILGLAYKADTDSVRNSPALALISALGPYRLRAYDPEVAVNGDWHPDLAQAKDALDAMAGADAVVVMTPWPAFGALSATDINKALRGRVVIDPYGVLDGGACVAAGLDYFCLGARPRGQGASDKE